VEVSVDHHLLTDRWQRGNGDGGHGDLVTDPRHLDDDARGDCHDDPAQTSDHPSISSSGRRRRPTERTVGGTTPPPARRPRLPVEVALRGRAVGPPWLPRLPYRPIRPRSPPP